MPLVVKKPAKPKPKMPTRDELWPKERKPYTWVGADNRKLARMVLDIVSKNKSTALDTEFPISGPRKDEAIIWSLSGAKDQRFVLDGHWLRDKDSPFIEWISDKNQKLVYFSFGADADTIEANAPGVDVEASFYADVKVQGWLRNNNKRRIALKEEAADYLKWYSKDYHHTFGYYPAGKSKWVTVSPDLIMEGPLPDEMLAVMPQSDWRKLFKLYSANDADMTHTLHRVNKVVLTRWGYWPMYLALDKPYSVTLRHFQKRGITIDFNELDRLDREITASLLRHRTALRLLANNPELGLNSQSKDLRKLIFEEWQWPTYEDLVTGAGAPQLNKVAWDRYAREEGFSFARLMLPHNKLTTLKNTFINGIRSGVKFGPGAATNTLYSEYNQTGTRSGRMSSRKFYVKVPYWKEYKRKPPVLMEKKVKAGMNMLNFPNKFNDAFGVRRVVVAPPPDDDEPDGYELVVGDFSGFELWMILYWCHKWGIKSKMLKHLDRDEDVHSMTAVAVCNLDCKWQDVKTLYPDKRNAEGKRCNFGLGYGAGARVFCRIMGWDTRDERNIRKAQRMIDTWNELWPEMAQYQKKCVQLGYKQGWIPSCAGNRIWVAEGLNSPDEGTVRHYENLCKNGPAQGSAAAVTKMAQNFIEVDKVMKELKYKQLFNVYDEVIGYVPKRNAKPAVVRQGELMEKAGTFFKLPFRLRHEVHSGPSWYDAK